MALHVECVTKVMAPRTSLAACVRAYVWRSTVGATLASPDRNNYFPASAACSITWFIQGSSQRMHEHKTLPATIVFRGPYTRPVSTFNAGPVQMFVLLLMPDALRAMTDIDAGQHLNRLSAAATVFDARWAPLLQAVQEASNDSARVQLIEAFLEPRWLAAREGIWASAGSYSTWAQALAARAGAEGIGRSGRQVERRVRTWSGMPMRGLRGLSRAEQSFLSALQLLGTRNHPRVNWADVALQAGYADQPHLCRELRRITGFSPQALLQRMRSDEGFWVYRAWRQAHSSVVPLETNRPRASG